jgi:hypothetical protein
MTIVKNGYGLIDLQQTAVELEKRIAALEESKKFLLEYGDVISARIDASEAAATEKKQEQV